MMEFGLREWLFVLGPVFIVGILAHGYWRMFSNRHNLKMSLDKTYVTKSGENESSDGDLSMFRAELPNGGARVRTIPEQTSLDLNQEVPVLMDSVQNKGYRQADESLVDKPIKAVRNEEVVAPSIADAPSIKASRTAPKELPEKFVVIYVIALNAPFKGQELLENLVEHGLSYGEMDIFHKLDVHDFSKFSLVNAVEPGTFDINSMGKMETPGISLFMRVHELTDPIGVFNEMIEVAQFLAQELGGEVRDESRSAMTHQTIEHSRLGISEYLLKNRQ
ncbi:MAG: cell division protein ZipA [Pseudomonadales bacterium]|nr:cell division protein ZipA [Pseudomonadales bacterium]